MTQKCIRCNEVKDISRFSKGMRTCKFCKWKEKHDVTIPNNWKEHDVYYVIQQIYDGQIETINELTEKTEKSLNEIIRLIHDDLHIKNIGNKPIKIGVNCENCGKYFTTNICFVLKNNFNFCSHECYSRFRSKYYVGDKASVYNKTEATCAFCGAKLLLPKNKIKSLNKEGVIHNFCNHHCYSQFRKIYYVGKRLYNTGKSMSDEWKEMCRINTTKCYSDGKFNRQTKPQIIVNNMLKQHNINFENEKNFKYYSVDNYLLDYNLGIEVMGDYFHSNPTKYNYDKLNTMQKKDVTRDKRKRTYIHKYYNINLLYLWEYDILNFPEKCWLLINRYIHNYGNLQDYQSYNYNMANNDIEINKEIINPYFIQNP